MTAQLETHAKKRLIASLIFNLCIVALEVPGLILSIQTHGAGLFQFYTQDSNLLALAACAVLAIATAAALWKGKTAAPGWAVTLKYMATTCLAVTFVVVIAILSPMEGKDGYAVMMLSGSMLYHHLLCPVLALVSFIFLEAAPPKSSRPMLTAFAPTALYAVVAVILNLLAVLDGPYPFLHVLQQPWYMSILWFVLILGGALLLSRLLLLANRRFSGEK